MNVSFLSVDDVLHIHSLQLSRYGGSAGLRDRGLLESAVAQPQVTAFGEFFHGDLCHMAAAYLFHIVRNHPFADGNKRTGLLSALEFLARNGIEILEFSEELYELTMGVAEGRVTKDNVAERLQSMVQRISDG